MTVKHGSDTLTVNRDYTLAYKNNTNAGKGIVTVTGKGDYTGSVKVTFTIKAVEIGKCAFAVADQTYTGKALKPDVTVKFGKAKLKQGTDYTLSYKNNKAVGVATVTVKGKGNFTGTHKLTFTINPAGTAFKQLTAGKGQIELTWTKVKQITGYEIEYSLKKNFSGSDTLTIKKASATKATLEGLKNRKKYYIRIRAFKTVGNETYYSEWSKAETVKTK